LKKERKLGLLTSKDLQLLLNKQVSAYLDLSGDGEGG